MDAMQQIAQLMNNMNMSSCQLAQGIVEDTFDALQGKNDFKRTMDNITQGFSKATVDDKGGSTQGQEKAYNCQSTEVCRRTSRKHSLRRP